MQQSIFVSIERKTIADYETGTIDENIFIDRLFNSPLLCLGESFGAIDVLLNGSNEGSPYSIITSEGELIANADGDAFMPEWLEIPILNGRACAICEPAVYKTPEEVKAASMLLNNANDAELFRNFDLKHLIQEGIFLRPKTEVLRNKDAIYNTCINDFLKLKRFYSTAAKAANCVVLFHLYNDYAI